RIAGRAAMAALKLSQSGSGQSAMGRGRGVDDTRMRALVGRQPAGDRVGLGIVMRAVASLARGNGRQHETRAEAPRQPTQTACAQTRLQPRMAVRRAIEPRAPELRVSP